MDRITHPTAVASAPDASISGTRGFFTNGDPGLSIPATEVPDWWLNLIQESLLKVLVDAGVAPSATDSTLLSQAIQTMATDRATPTGSIMMFSGTNIPDKWLLLDGNTHNRADYPALWTHAQASGNMASDGTDKAANPGKFGPGNGTTTFQVPMISDFVRGTAGGAHTIGHYEADAIQGFKIQVPYSTSNASNSGIGGRNDCGTFINADLTPVSDGTNGTPRIANETRPKSVAFPYIIRI